MRGDEERVPTALWCGIGQPLRPARRGEEPLKQLEMAPAGSDVKHA